MDFFGAVRPRTRPVPTRGLSVASLGVLATLLAACGSGSADSSAGTEEVTATGDSSQSLTIYSGRSEDLVQPIIDKLEKATGTTVEVRYGGSSELAAQLLEEGDASGADLFFSQDAGALGALAKTDQLRKLDEATTSQVIDGYADPEGRWVATSARARVVAFNPDQAPEAARLASIDDILDPKYKGKIGFAPTNASFHAFVTALRVSRGEAAAKEWLERFKANEPRAYEKNGAVLNGVDSGEVALGLINHYYWYEKVEEEGQDKVKAKIHFFEPTDPGALVNVAGVGVLAGTDAPDAATKAVNYLISPPAQEYFADETFEYPVIEAVKAADGLPALQKSSIDLNNLDSLDRTLDLLGQVGLT